MRAVSTRDSLAWQALEGTKTSLQRLFATNDELVFFRAELNVSRQRLARRLMQVARTIPFAVAVGHGFAQAVKAQQAGNARDFVAAFRRFFAAAALARAIGTVVELLGA